MKTSKEPSRATAQPLPTALLRFYPVRRWYVPSHQKRWKPLQPCTPPSEDQGSESTDKVDAVYRRRCPNRIDREYVTATHALLRTGL